jgi:hypothetical protein
MEVRVLMGRLAWVVLGCVVLLVVAGELLSLSMGSGVDAFTLAGLAFPITGALIVSHRPGNAIGWIMLGIGAGEALSTGFGIYAHYTLTVWPGSLPGAALGLALEGPMWVPLIGLSGTFLILLFPDGRLPSPRWRPWAYFCGFALILCFTALLILPGSFGEVGYPDVENPLGIEALEPFASAFVSTVALIPIAIVGSAVALIRRFRRSRGLTRVQLKWLATSAGVVATVYLALMALNFPSLMAGSKTPEWLDTLANFGIFAFFLIPVAIGVAILRHRLYEIDVIINRTLVYGALTATLTAAYFILVTAFQGLLRPLAGTSELAVAGSTLVVAAMFRPARARIQAFVDRRFYRSKFDAELTLENFSARIRQEVDLEALTTHLLAVVDQTMRPATLSLWLRGPASFHESRR